MRRLAAADGQHSVDQGGAFRPPGAGMALLDPGGRLTGMRKLAPWLVVLGVARVVIDHYLAIDRRDRQQARRALTRSRLRPGRLTPEERENLRRIAGQVQKKRLAYEATAAAVPFPMPDLYKKKKRRRRGRKAA